MSERSRAPVARARERTEYKVGLVAVVVLAIIGLVVWRGRNEGGTPASSAATSQPAGIASVIESRTKPDPRTLARGSISGTITNETGQPIGKAKVCGDARSWQLPASVTRDPICAVTDTAGRYTLPNLLAAGYTVSASARPYKPDAYYPTQDRKRATLELAAGEAKVGIDIVLHHGGVEITGVVSDLTGGPVPHAQVRARSGMQWSQGADSVIDDADDHGAFSLWVKPGSVTVTATADGYASNEEQGRAPGTFDIVLTPESSLAGTVVDAATNQPLAGVHVSVQTGPWGWGGEADVTDEAGVFRVTRLLPGRYTAVATGEAGYGRSDGSTLVGLGQHVEGVVVKLFPARRISGTIVIAGEKQRCKDGWVALHDATADRRVWTHRELDGTLHAEGVLPGTYAVSVRCEGYQSRDSYDKIVVKDKDLTDLVWEVDPGGTIRGHLATKSGDPVEDAQIWANNVGGAAREKSQWSGDRSRADGSYALTGLKAGTYRIDVHTERGIAPNEGYKVDVPANGKVDKDIVLDDGGKLTGTVVDDSGKPVPEVNVVAMPLDRQFNWGMPDIKSDAAGTFTIDTLRAGDYRVTAQHGWADELKKPGTTDDAKQGEKVTIRIAQTSTVKLVVEAQNGTIKGSVVDTDGKPIGDAYVAAAHESDAAGAQQSNVAATRDNWWGDDAKPVLTSTDGNFAVTRLAPGRYTLRAYRKGGGEAIAEHVAVGTTAKLQIKATGSIEGTATPAPDELKLQISDLATGYHRVEQLYMTKGAFTVRDLPKGHFHLDISGGGSQKSLELDLGEAEHKTGIAVTLDTLVSITGRLVEHGTQKPVPGIYVIAQLARGGGNMMMFGDEDTDRITDETGRFTVKNVPLGLVSITGMAKDWKESAYGWFRAVRTVTGSGTVDVGDIPVLKKRVKPGDAAGELGINFVDQPEDTPPEKQEFKVSFIDPAGPAAKVDIKVGDVVTSVDGTDVSGANATNFYTLTQAPPGTKVTLGLARGTSVAVTLAAP